MSIFRHTILRATHYLPANLPLFYYYVHPIPYIFHPIGIFHPIATLYRARPCTRAFACIWTYHVCPFFGILLCEQPITCAPIRPPFYYFTRPSPIFSTRLLFSMESLLCTIPIFHTCHGTHLDISHISTFRRTIVRATHYLHANSPLHLLFYTPFPYIFHPITIFHVIAVV